MPREDVVVPLHTQTAVFISVTSVEGIKCEKQWRKKGGGDSKILILWF